MIQTELKGVRETVGKGLTVTVIESFLEQELPSVAVTKYLVLVVGDTTLTGLVEELSQIKEDPVAVAVRVVDWPVQIVVLPEILSKGSGFTTADALAESEQALASENTYLRVCVPTPAEAGLKEDPVTPTPEYTPPAGTPPFKLKDGALTHEAGGLENVTMGLGVTVMVF